MLWAPRSFHLYLLIILFTLCYMWTPFSSMTHFTCDFCNICQSLLTLVNGCAVNSKFCVNLGCSHTVKGTEAVGYTSKRSAFVSFRVSQQNLMIKVTITVIITRLRLWSGSVKRNKTVKCLCRTYPVILEFQMEATLSLPIYEYNAARHTKRRPQWKTKREFIYFRMHL